MPAWALGADPSAPLLLEKAARRPPPIDCDPAAGGVRAAASIESVCAQPSFAPVQAWPSPGPPVHHRNWKVSRGLDLAGPGERQQLEAQRDGGRLTRR